MRNPTVKRSSRAAISDNYTSRRRHKAQAEGVEDFHGAVLSFLAFHPTHFDLADRLARVVTDHATPVGSGTGVSQKRLAEPIRNTAAGAPVRLTLDDGEELAGYIAAEANHTKVKATKQKLDAIFARI